MCSQNRADIPKGLSDLQDRAKRRFDLCFAIPGFLVALPVIFISAVVSSLETGEWGIFSQERIGRYGKPFMVHKIRSMRTSIALTSTVTTSRDPRITRFGALIRRLKLDELPQLWNVIVGDMSLVGPRPDVAGWSDLLAGDDRVLLSVRPGITGPASLAFRDEESLLSEASDPDQYNRAVIWPRKIMINRNYISNWSLRGDVELLLETFGVKCRRNHLYSRWR